MGFEPATFGFIRFYEEESQKSFGPNLPKFLENRLLFGIASVKNFLNAYARVRTRDLWLQNLFVLPTGPCKMNKI